MMRSSTFAAWLVILLTKTVAVQSACSNPGAIATEAECTAFCASDVSFVATPAICQCLGPGGGLWSTFNECVCPGGDPCTSSPTGPSVPTTAVTDPPMEAPTPTAPPPTPMSNGQEMSCEELQAKGMALLEDPSCILVKAVIDGDDILDGTTAEVSSVCSAQPTCVDQYLSLISEVEAKGCVFDADTTQFISDVKLYAGDVNIVTNYFCKNNCYAVVQSVDEQCSDGVTDACLAAATCVCLEDFLAETAKLSSGAKDALGIDAVTIAMVKAGASMKGCSGSPETSASAVYGVLFPTAATLGAGFLII